MSLNLPLLSIFEIQSISPMRNLLKVTNKKTRPIYKICSKTVIKRYGQRMKCIQNVRIQKENSNRSWEMILEHNVAWFWKERADSRNVCVKRNKVLLMLYYIDKNWYHLIKEYLEKSSKIAFQEVARPVGWRNRYILEIFIARRHILVAQNHQASFRLHHWGWK